MSGWVGVWIDRVRRATRPPRGDQRGNVAVLFALTAVAAATAVGGGLDLTRGYFARQQLSAAAALTCQYASRPSVAEPLSGTDGTSTYIGNVTAFLTKALARQGIPWAQTNATPFSYAPGGAATVSLASKVPTTLMKLIGVAALPVSASQQCFAALPDQAASPPTAAGSLLVKEGFENFAGPTSYNWYTPNGTVEAPGTAPYTNVALNAPPSSPGYVGVNGTRWLIMGYCLEVDTVGTTVSTVPEGSHSAELDCDNGQNSKGNSSISTQVYLTAGSYELRWDYAARIPNLYYGTSYICGTTASDTFWANDTSYAAYGTTFGARTNQINVYLDLNSSGSPPVHTTLDGTQRLAGANMIDECVYSSGWIERGVKITVTTAGNYWLSFAADGANDSFGGQIDNIRLCSSTCAGTPEDDFPPSWLPASNGGNDVTLFEDNFESPAYSGGNYSTGGNPGVSYGGSQAWDEQGKGWGSAPTNQLPYWLTGCPHGGQCVELGWNSTSPGGSASNSLISKPFLLVPGYYQISYDYVSEELFSGLTTVYCGATPSAAGITALLSKTGTAVNRVLGVANGTQNQAVNAVGLFMSHAQLASTPHPSATLGAATTFTNPDGTVTTTPIASPSAISLTNYNAAQVNPVLDICAYAPSAQTRSRIVYIQKPALYWLTFASLNTTTAFGGQIDDVRITALGSPFMANTPASAVTIPVPNPQVGTSISFTGFSIAVQP